VRFEMQKDSYVLVTPCKNEEENLSNLVCSIESQTIKPVLWVIVDDGSTDGTGEIISCAEREHDWIKGINLDEHPEYMGKHYAYVCNKGFELAVGYCKKNGIKYEYIGLVDADNILEKEYFEKLINEFEKDPKLGIASGFNAYADLQSLLSDLRKSNPEAGIMDEVLWNLYDSPSVQVQLAYEDKPMGSARIWRKKCFEETGNGYLLAYAPDSISNVKANLRGWKTRRFKDAKIIERAGTITQGAWGGGIRVGKFDYFIGRPLYYSFLRTIKFTFKKSFLFGLAHFYGYLTSMIKKEDRVDDLEVLDYYQNIRIQELKKHYTRKFKQRLNVSIGERR